MEDLQMKKSEIVRERCKKLILFTNQFRLVHLIDQIARKKKLKDKNVPVVCSIETRYILVDYHSAWKILQSQCSPPICCNKIPPRVSSTQTRFQATSSHCPLTRGGNLFSWVIQVDKEELAVQVFRSLKSRDRQARCRGQEGRQKERRLNVERDGFS